MIKQKQLVPKRRFEGFNEEWNNYKLEEILNVNSGRDYKHLNKGNIPVYGTGGLMLRVDDKLSSIDGIGIGRKGTINKPQYLKAPFWTVDTLFFMTPLFNSDLYFMYSKSQTIDWKSMDESSGVPSLSKDTIEKINIYTPEHIEQQKIGQFFKHLDEMISLEQGKIDKTKSLKSAYLAEMFPAEGERVPKRRFAGFTEEWKEIDLGKLGKIQSGIGFPEKEQGGKKGIPFIKVSDMNILGNEIQLIRANHYVNQKQIDEKRWHPIVDTPAIVFAKVGAAIFLGRKRLISKPFLIDNNMMSYSFDTSWDINFGKILFEKINLSKYAQVGALPSLSASDIENIKIRIPTKKEQFKIGKFFKSLDDIITTHQLKLDKLIVIKQAYLHEMFV